MLTLGAIESRQDAVRTLSTFLQAFTLADRGYTILIREFTGQVGISIDEQSRVAIVTRAFFDDLNVAYHAVTNDWLPQNRIPPALLGELGQKYGAAYMVGSVGGAGAILDRAEDALAIYQGSTSEPPVGPALPPPGIEPTPADPEAWRKLYPPPAPSRGPSVALRVVGVLTIVGVAAGGVWALRRRSRA